MLQVSWFSWADPLGLRVFLGRLTSSTRVASFSRCRELNGRAATTTMPTGKNELLRENPEGQARDRSACSTLWPPNSIVRLVLASQGRPTRLVSDGSSRMCPVILDPLPKF
uniref:Secreted protein n=1 Tax=Ditylenchus dipsaci TaxID=166011 RepID=A0A915DLJ5_9BILA